MKNAKKILVFFAMMFVFLSITTSAQSLISPANNSTILVSIGQTNADIAFSWQQYPFNPASQTWVGYQVWLDGSVIGSIDHNLALTTLSASVSPGNHTWFVRAYFYTNGIPLNYDYPSGNFSVQLAPPKISSFSQSPDPLYNGGSGTVYVHLSQGSGNLTYSWYLSYSPSNMTASITPQGDHCQIYYYIPYNTKPTVSLTCVVSNSVGTDVKSYTLNVASVYPFTW